VSGTFLVFSYQALLYAKELINLLVNKYYASDNLLCKICIANLTFTAGVIICVTLLLFICTVFF